MTAGAFSEGLALVNVGGTADYHSIDGGKWGYVDRNGRFAIPPRFAPTRGEAYDWSISSVSRFNEGLAAASRPDGRFGFIDRTGESAIEPGFDEVRTPFRDGLAEVVIHAKVHPLGERGEYTESVVGYLDRAGTIVWPR